MAELTARDREILTFEREWWKYADAKEAALRERLDLTPQRCYGALDAIIDQPGALAHDPLLARRLRRQRSTRQRVRRAHRDGSVRG